MADGTDRSSLTDAIAATERELGPLGVAVNAAGIADANPAEEVASSQLQSLIDINLTGVFLSCQAEAATMLSHRTGSIINIASMSGVVVNRGLSQAHHTASKAGVIHLTKSLAMEWVDRGIRVNSISPGYTATLTNTRAEMRRQTDAFTEQTPMRRMANPNEIVGRVIFLASDAASYCTGVDLLGDGGFVCAPLRARSSVASARTTKRGSKEMSA